jgi:hypothetical protein
MMTLAQQVLTAARRVPQRDRATDSKVWINDVFASYRVDTKATMSLDQFKAAIVEDMDCRRLLARCDLVQAFKPAMVSASMTEYRIGDHVAATYNFVRV